MSRTYYCATCLNSFPQNAERCPNLACGADRPASGWGVLLQAGDLLDRHYKINKLLAVGGAGITYLAREIDGDGKPIEPDLAIKVLFAQRDSGPFLRRLANEAQILQELAHDNIVECHGFVNRRGHAPYLLTLFERGGNLFEHIKRVGPLPPRVSAGVLTQILRALDVAHQRGVVHRDLKPQNVLLRTRVGAEVMPRCLVADFGIAKVSGGLNQGLTQIGTFVGTPEFAAPEQFAGSRAEPATDVFAAGALLHYVLTGSPPFKFSSRRDIGQCFSELLEQIPPQLPPAFTHPVLQRVLDGTMQADATQRWTAQQVLAELATLSARPMLDESDTVGITNLLDDVVSPLQTDPDHFQTMVPGDLFFDDEAGDVGLAEEPPSPQPPPAPAPAPAPAPVPRPAPTPPAPMPTASGRTRLRPRKETPPAHLAHTASRSELSLDDLFGGPSTPEPEPELPVAVPEPEPYDPFARTLDEPEVVDAAFDTMMEPVPAAPEPEPEPAAAPVPLTEWYPDDVQPLPPTLPDDPGRLLRLLGAVHPAERGTIMGELRDHPGLSDALSRYRTGGDPALGRGVGLAIAGLGRNTWASTARTLLSDPDAGVRCCAAQALGAVGSASMLVGLRQALSDSDARVRAAAALALGKGCAANNRGSLGQSWLNGLERDSDPRVRRAWEQAMAMLT